MPLHLAIKNTRRERQRLNANYEKNLQKEMDNGSKMRITGI